MDTFASIAFIILLIVLAAILLVGFLGFYFLPTIVARRRYHYNKEAIFILNLVAGWTMLGWVSALVWAYTRPVR
jgi:hypothetical protein